jgi:hypothetical protein
MSNNRSPEEEAEYQCHVEGMKILGNYFVMRRFKETGEWFVVGPKVPIRGLAAAQEALERYRNEGYDGDPSDLQVLPEIGERLYRQARNELNAWCDKKGYERPSNPPWRYNQP